MEKILKGKFIEHELIGEVVDILREYVPHRYCESVLVRLAGCPGLSVPVRTESETVSEPEKIKKGNGK